jgi:transcriptional regulator with XRE-family HTH domain
MSAHEAFGPNLRRRRTRGGISLEEIAAETRVSIDLWEALERNDFSRWPAGIYARAYIRAYAAAIGVDPDETVNEFCRWFPEGDRRTERLVRGASEIVGHQLVWQDDLPHSVGRDRRASSTQSERSTRAVPPLRLIAALLDLSAVALVSGTLVAVLPVGISPALAVAAVLYHAVSLALTGSTPAVWAIDTYVKTHPDFMRGDQVFLFRRLQRTGSDESPLQGRTIS